MTINKLINYQLSTFNDDTILNGKKILDWKKMDMTVLSRSISKMKDSAERDYLIKWVFENYYLKKKLKRTILRNLTAIIKDNFTNKISYCEIMRRCFDDVDILNSNKTNKKILDEDSCKIIQQMHSINASLTGTFLDYLIRRIICEIRNTEFIDSRATHICKTQDDNVKISDGLYDTWIYDGKDELAEWLIKEKDDFNSKIIGTLTEGDKFIVLEKNEKWMKIFYKNMIGWVRIMIPNNENFRVLDTPELEYVPNKYFRHFQMNCHYCQYGCNYKIENMRCFPNKEGEFEQGAPCYLPICRYLAYEYVKDTSNYATEDLVQEIFITSLAHTECFMQTPRQSHVDEILNILKDEINCDILYKSLLKLSNELIENKKNILLNPGLGGKLCVDGPGIPADCDIVTDNILCDFKCTNSKSQNSAEVYEILQLLGYTSLLKLNIKFNIDITKICIVNLFKGEIIEYNIDYITKENLIRYYQMLV
jgi:hypothetical protein